VLEDYLYLGGCDFIDDYIVVKIDEKRTQFEKKKRMTMVEHSHTGVCTDCKITTFK
jgi:hypothetical protein